MGDSKDAVTGFVRGLRSRDGEGLVKSMGRFPCGETVTNERRDREVSGGFPKCEDSGVRTLRKTNFVQEGKHVDLLRMRKKFVVEFEDETLQKRLREPAWTVEGYDSTSDC